MGFTQKIFKEMIREGHKNQYEKYLPDRSKLVDGQIKSYIVELLDLPAEFRKIETKTAKELKDKIENFEKGWGLDRTKNRKYSAWKYNSKKEYWEEVEIERSELDG